MEFNPQNQAWLEVCVTPESLFFLMIFTFQWFINFQTSPVHFLYVLDLDFFFTTINDKLIWEQNPEQTRVLDTLSSRL